ncbi:peptidylprolyl isomerase [Sphingomonas sp. BE138]|uniref:peptidylprolyl isomerase n=1 Tax=Sphingomonas sp. BE138 TaxID=2817845 RepID=UPI00285F681A|nr:peptidylprolyl isomerase [Sphingomonas sp. BE138]MDR6788718.1 peptidylprolyl isomerase [Sphingomonas sp. BE138]
MTPLAPLFLLLQAPAAPTTAPPPAHEPASQDWRDIPANELLVMRLAGDRTVVIRLAAALAPAHVANIRRLAAAGWWNGESVYRVQENWVAQWGDATEKKPLPRGVAASVTPEFEIAAFAPAQRMTRADTHSATAGITADGWPVASDGQGHAWLTHCYSMVGVARDEAPTSGSGAELFTPIGQSARRLDRNYAVVGRVISGMEHLSALPRGPAPMGVLPEAATRMRIVSVTLGSAMSPAERPRFQYRAADNPRFAALIRRRENPPAPTIGSGGADVCEVPLEVRRAP